MEVGDGEVGSESEDESEGLGEGKRNRDRTPAARRTGRLLRTDTVSGRGPAVGEEIKADPRIRLIGPTESGRLYEGIAPSWR